VSWLPPDLPYTTERFVELASHQLTLLANAQGRTCHRVAVRGELVVAVEEVLAGLRALGYRVLRASLDSGWTLTTYPMDMPDAPAPDSVQRPAASFVLVHPLGCVEVDSHMDRPIRALAVDERQVALLQERMAQWVRPIDRDAGVLHMLKADGAGGFEFDAIGTGARALRRENYTADVLDGVDHVAHDIEAADPCGRISMLTGPPGTGKTHILRGILAIAKRPCWVVLQAGDLPDLVQVFGFRRGDQAKRLGQVDLRGEGR
jgi:hypothetical protein